jgi:hypothetical protein
LGEACCKNGTCAGPLSQPQCPETASP